MISHLKKAFSHCTAALFDNSFYTIRTSMYLRYIRSIRHIAESESRPLENPKYKTFLLSRLLLYLAILMYIARIMYIIRLQIKGHSLREHVSLDPFLSVVVLMNPFLNYLTLSAIILLFFFTIFLDHYFSFSFDFYLSDMLYNIVSNGDQFFTLNGHLQLPQEVCFSKQKEAYLRLRHWYKRMRNPPLPRPIFVHSKPPLTNVSPRVRTRLVLQCHLYEGLFACLNLTIALGLLLFIVIFLFLAHQELSLRMLIVAIGDAFLIALILFHSITNLCFGFYSLILPQLLTRAHIKELNHSLMRLLLQLRYLKGHHTSSHQTLLQRQLTFFYGEHHFLAYFQQYFNSKVASGFSLAAFLTNLLLQMIFLNLVLRKELNVFEMTSILGFLFFQVTLLWVACRVVISWTDALYSSAPLLYQAQFLLRRPANAFAYPRHLSAKLHLMRNFELLCTQEKERFTVGPFADISTSALFQFFFAYTGFFMYISMLMADLRFY